MSILKEHREFHRVDLYDESWHTPLGYPTGIRQRILSGQLDEANRTGNRTRLLRFEAGARTDTVFVHDYWEEVYVITGDLIVGNGNDGAAQETFGANTYACRPPGISHGPFKSSEGCLLLEFHYYA